MLSFARYARVICVALALFLNSWKSRPSFCLSTQELFLLEFSCEPHLLHWGIRRLFVACIVWFGKCLRHLPSLPSVSDCRPLCATTDSPEDSSIINFVEISLCRRMLTNLKKIPEQPLVLSHLLLRAQPTIQILVRWLLVSLEIWRSRSAYEVFRKKGLLIALNSPSPVLDGPERDISIEIVPPAKRRRGPACDSSLQNPRASGYDLDVLV